MFGRSIVGRDMAGSDRAVRERPSLGAAKLDWIEAVSAGEKRPGDAADGTSGRLSASARLAAIVLVTHYLNRNSRDSRCGLVWPSMATLGRVVGVKARRAHDLVSELVDDGWIEAVHLGFGDPDKPTGRSNYYRIVWSRAGARDPFEGMQFSAGGSAISCRGVGNKLQGGMQQTADDSPVDSQEENLRAHDGVDPVSQAAARWGRLPDLIDGPAARPAPSAVSGHQVMPKPSSEQFEVWQRVHGRLRSELGPATWTTWLRDLSWQGVIAGAPTILCRTDRQREWLNANVLGRFAGEFAAEGFDGCPVVMTAAAWSDVDQTIQANGVRQDR